MNFHGEHLSIPFIYVDTVVLTATDRAILTMLCGILLLTSLLLLLFIRYRLA